MVGKRLLWGDVNAALNRLVAEGVIASFRTSFGGPAPELGVHVVVTAPQPVSDLQAEDIRSRVELALAQRVPATVTVDRSLGETSW